MAATKVLSMFCRRMLNNPLRLCRCSVTAPGIRRVSTSHMCMSEDISQLKGASKSQNPDTQINPRVSRSAGAYDEQMMSNKDLHENIAAVSFGLKEKKRRKLKNEFPSCGEIIHEDENIVAFNKPQGTSVFGQSEIFKGKRVLPSSTTVPLAHMLPDLAEKFQSPDLNISMSIKSFYSGVLVLCKHEEAHRQLHKLVKTMNQTGTLYKSYLVITMGVPQCQHGTQLHTFIKKQFLHNHELSVIDDKDSGRARKDRKMSKVVYKVELLVNNKELGVALVKVSVNRDKWAAVECMLSHFLSPVLGDEIYSARVSSLMNLPIPVSPHNARPKPQKLPKEVLKALSSDPSLPSDIHSRLHVHRYQVALVRFPKRTSAPLTITATPPAHFLSVLKCLDLYRHSMFHSTLQ